MQIVYGLVFGALGFVLTYNEYPLIPVLIGTWALYFSTVITHSLVYPK